MYHFTIDDPNAGFGAVMEKLAAEGIKTDSRNGPVIRFPKPVCLEYVDPRRRIIDHPIRDANHFFHLFETMWMFAGLQSVEPLNLYNNGMKNYSDDGVNFAAAYGHRWRKHFGFDQIARAVQKLKKNPEDRRVVIQIWDASELDKDDGKDFACNQQILFDTRPSKHLYGGYALDMTVTNRSNDLVYGAMGSNMVHFSMLHEYVAAHAGLAMGSYYQISKNMHLYLENETSKRCWENRGEFFKQSAPSTDRSLSQYGTSICSSSFKHFVEDGKILQPGIDTYLSEIVKPVCEAYRIYKLNSLLGLKTSVERRVDLALDVLSHCKSEMWRSACETWFQTRLTNAIKKTA